MAHTNGTGIKTLSVPASGDPIFGLWQPNIALKHLFYGKDCVNRYLLQVLPTSSSRAFILTGRSIATKTSLIQELEQLLGEHHAGTYSKVRQHGPLADLEEALDLVLRDDTIDTIISVGGGSPIDTAKTISYRVSGSKGRWLYHISIPTTLSAAECTPGGGYTKADGVKTGFMAPEMAVKSIFYDPHYASYTPQHLWLSSGIRALDHAVESLYHPYASEIWKTLAVSAAQSLLLNLPKVRDVHPQDENLTTSLQLAAYMSSGLKGSNIKGGMGLSHSLGHALGSPYGIGHGVTSCITLGHVVKMKAMASKEDAQQITKLLPAIQKQSTGDVTADACEVGNHILRLVEDLGLAPGTLTELGVDRAQAPLITSRACGGLTEGPVYDQVYNLVGSLF